MPILKVVNAAFSYKTKDVFENISFEVEPGEVFCIVGPNGCGKTTLIDCILGLSKLKSGEILIHGKPLESYKARDLARHVAYVPQNHKLTFGYSVLDVVSMGRTYEARMFQPPSDEEIEYAKYCLKLVGLDGFEERDYTKLSGGELQLVLIARALCQKAEVLVMDEPTAHLDFRHELNVMEIISSLVKNQRISIVMATHFLNQAFYLENAGVNTRVALINDKSFEAIGSASETLTQENLDKIFNVVTEIVGEEADKRKYIIPLYNKR